MIAVRARPTRRNCNAAVLGLAVASWLVFAKAAHADPWLAPGDEGVRHDIQLLADAGILRGPTTTWPLSWPDIARDAGGASPANLDAGTAAALMRIQRMAREASGSGLTSAGVELSAANEIQQIRSFADSPREQAELKVHAGWLSNHVALNLQGAAVSSPEDGKKLRPDGSYLGVNLGNFMISAGYMERWWGPGWDGSLILSTNARPIPSVTLERNYTDPFESSLLSWIGPWRASIAVGQMEEHDVPLEKVRFLAARVNFKPRPWLEFGLTRTAQWCGGERECGWNTFSNMLLGRDNQVNEGNTEQPGNQMAGYDMRMRSPWRRLPLAFFTQWIGEDEAGGLPSKFLGLFGVEGWGSSRFGSVRVRAEYADTACSFSREQPEFDCAYRNSIYPQGYAYRGRIIGHSLDNDSRMYSVGAILALPRGDVLSLRLRRMELNRNGGTHSISSAPLEVDNVELRYSTVHSLGKVSLGLGFDDTPMPAAGSNSDTRAFVSWQQGF